MSDSTKLDNARELAYFLNTSVGAIRKWTKLGSIPVVKCGRSCRYDRTAVLKALQAHHEKGGSNAS
jgi:excisionase family DNA binding protein